LAVDCIPHSPGNTSAPAAQHAAMHHRARVVPVHHAVVAKKSGATPVVYRHHVRLRECAPGTAALPLSDLTNENVAEIYLLPTAPYAGPLGGAGAPGVASDASALAPAGDAASATPAEASGTDLPVPNLSDIGSIGGPTGGSGPGVIGLPSGLSNSPSGGGVGPGATPGGGGPGGNPGGSTGPGGTTPTNGGTTPPVVVIVPPTTTPGTGPAGPGPGLVAGVPEPGTWAMMLVGLGAIGGVKRYRRTSGRRLVTYASNAERRADRLFSRRD